MWQKAWHRAAARRAAALWMLGFLLAGHLPAQNDFVHVRSVVLSGHHKTKTRTILRELDFRAGDSIALNTLSERLEHNRRLLINTGLFNTATLNIRNWNTDTGWLDIAIDVAEAWYFYPFPVFELADRNFNVWWVEQHAALNRINFGGRLYWQNFTGRRDLLKVVAQTGYVQKYELNYNLPFFDRRQRLGLNFQALHARNREIGYTTASDRLRFLRLLDENLLRRWRGAVQLSFRPGLYQWHFLKLEYSDNRIAPAVSNWNPDFLGPGRLTQQYATLQYDYVLDRRDLRYFPLNGYAAFVQLRKDGLLPGDALKALSVTGQWAQYASLGTRWSAELLLQGRLAWFEGRAPYYNSTALGYGDAYLRGYEYYVMDGTHYALAKSSLRWQLFDRLVDWGTWMPIRKFRIMPLRLYLSVNNDAGYARNLWYNAGNTLANRWLWGGGLGFNIVAYHNKVVQIEYSLNQLWEKGVFLHYKLGF